MSPKRPPRDVPASVRARLHNLARRRSSTSPSCSGATPPNDSCTGFRRPTRCTGFWDIACLARRFAFDGETLRNAIAETFRRRGTPFTSDRPPALLSGYYEHPARVQHWQVLHRQITTGADSPARLVDVGERRFLGPVCDSLIENSPFTQGWLPGGPWRSGLQAPAGGESGD